MDKKDNIINSAIELFASKGFEGTSVRDIAAHAGVNLAMINYYFGSKEKLFESIVEYRASVTRLHLEEILKDQSLSDIAKIDNIIEFHVNKVFANRFFHRVIHQEIMLSQRDSLQLAIIQKLMYPNSMIVKNIIEEGIKHGSFKKVDTALTIATMFGSINQVLLSKRLCNSLIDKEEDYIPYEDDTFKQRVIDHMKQLMHAHLLA
ncbi:TetR family transcriptional regulator [Foetidibacter luteolus]|uniref:TetR family transcriptional regulator n=1 Tax=Foetidibacter luteolus TaxID=2608880 RepID=UPI00129BC389|nr:TetR family transcriptional regulator [Foetidibacter luteolus]